MGINNIEDVIAYKLKEFYKQNGNRKILKIIVSPKQLIELRNLIEERYALDRHFMSPEEQDELHNGPVYWNNIPIESNPRTKRIIIVPEGTLAGAIYE